MTDISHLIDMSDSGAWAKILPFCVNIQILDQATDDSTDADRLAVPDVIVPFHTTNTNELCGDNNDA